jgi:glutamyl-tRNA synthetase/glutamyl-Q tRNA(Asp) synthetase
MNAVFALHDARPLATRFAPSPTGYLHLGHVVNAIYVWGVARARAARVRLRIEDHDRIRCRPEFERALLEDLDWLGFIPDEGLDPLDRQSDRPAVYEAALQRLAVTNQVYGCRCSRKAIGGEYYGGRCRDRQIAPGLPGCGVRVTFAPGIEHFEDLRLGPIDQDPAVQCGDLLLKDRDGHWTYQFAVTVDDMTQGITLVIRGEDLAASTGRQIKLARMLGQTTPPAYLHHPLIIGAQGDKLSKAARDTGIRELRAQGVRPEDVIGRAAAAVGLAAPGARIAAADVATLFA